MSSVQPCLTKDLYIHVGAPDPIKFRLRAGGSGGALVSFDDTLKFTFSNAAGVVTLGVGTGITLEDDEAVTDARAVVQLTVAQSRAIPDGPLTKYEVQRTVSGRENVIFMGLLIGEGGDNPDG